MSDEERNSINNLMLLCCNCYQEIDSNPKEFPVTILKEMKKEHEEHMEKIIREGITAISHTDFMSNADSIIQDYPSTSQMIDLERQFSKESPDCLIPIESKLIGNVFSEDVKNLINEGLSQTSDFAEYINLHPDINFKDKLLGPIIKRYHEIRSHTNNNDIFYELLEFCNLNPIEADGNFTAISIVTYLYERCEVFAF